MSFTSLSSVRFFFSLALVSCSFKRVKVPLQGVFDAIRNMIENNTIWKLSSGRHWLIWGGHQCFLTFANQCGCLSNVSWTAGLFQLFQKSKLRCKMLVYCFYCCSVSYVLGGIMMSMWTWGLWACLTFILQKLASIFSCSTSFLAWPTLMVLFTGVSPFILATNTTTFMNVDEMETYFFIRFCFFCF